MGYMEGLWWPQKTNVTQSDKNNQSPFVYIYTVSFVLCSTFMGQVFWGATLARAIPSKSNKYSFSKFYRKYSISYGETTVGRCLRLFYYNSRVCFFVCFPSQVLVFVYVNFDAPEKKTASKSSVNGN